MLTGSNIGWLDQLAQATDQQYFSNGTGGPTIKVITINSTLNSSSNIVVKSQDATRDEKF